MKKKLTIEEAREIYGVERLPEDIDNGTWREAFLKATQESIDKKGIEYVRKMRHHSLQLWAYIKEVF